MDDMQLARFTRRLADASDRNSLRALLSELHEHAADDEDAKRMLQIVAQRLHRLSTDD